jgi:hypothetical protein
MPGTAPPTSLTVDAAPPAERATSQPVVRALPLIDVALALAAGVAALAVRLPNFLTIPRFTDELLDVLYTLPLYRLQALPMVGFDPYNGPLISWLIALSLWVFGPQPWAPRMAPLLLGSGAVVLTYLLGRVVGGRLAGLLAAGLLATSAVHVLVNSHISWSNATTPFFTTLAMLVIGPAFSRASGRHLALGGLTFGLALQSHPSVFAFLPGVGLALLLQRPGLIRTRWLVLAGGLFVLIYSSVVAYNLYFENRDYYWELARGAGTPRWGALSDGSFGRLDHEQRLNADGRQSGLAAYPANLAQLAVNLPRVAAGLIEPRPLPTDFLREPTFWLYGALVLVGLLYPLTRRNLLLPLGGLSFLLLLPYFNGKFEPIFNGRYVAPLLPLAFVGFGCLVGDLWRPAQRARLRVGLALAAAALVLYPLFPLVRYEQRNAADGQINLDLIASVASLVTSRQPDEPLLLDDSLGRRNLTADGDLLQVLRVLLEFRGQQFSVGPASVGKLDGALGNARTALVVFAQPYDRALEARWRFTQLEERTSGRYAVYRLERRG